MPTAKDIIIKQVVTIKEDASISDLANVLTKNKMSGLPVINKNNSLVGFVSGKDIITFLVRPRFAKKKVKDIMVKKVITANKNTSIEEISKIFSEKPIRCLPVLDSGKLIGVVLRKAVVNRLLGHYY